MTMKDGKCGVCDRDGAIGVASTIMPYSCAYCRECLEHFAQPEVVFETIFGDVGEDWSKMDADIADSIVTYKAGQGYISYKTWAAARAQNKEMSND